MVTLQTNAPLMLLIKQLEHLLEGRPVLRRQYEKLREQHDIRTSVKLLIEHV